ncbi:MAG: adenylyltransferase/cytidyltransferase family protein [Rhodobacteraceae bacterium]|nr:adenylyltransferase/cytidyltransferase family protein [Paracoccaceae bacterium]
MGQGSIGYTTGVFDLFHIGHLNILRRAKLSCDYLIVGVTTDELCFQRKKKKPVIPFAERVDIVQSLRFVDQVVPQDDMDKIAAWERLRFNKMMVGSDWRGTPAWNALEREFKDRDVEIVYFPYTETTSSTLLRQALNALTGGD